MTDIFSLHMSTLQLCHSTCTCITYYHTILFFSLTASMQDFYLLLNGNIYTSIYSDAANVGKPNMNTRNLIAFLYKADILTVTNNASCTDCYISLTVLSLRSVSDINSEFMVGQSQMFNNTDPATFDVIIENKGGHYNPNTFTYTTPVNGTYVIMISTACSPWMSSKQYITVNGVKDVMTSAQCHSYDSVLSGGNLLVTPLSTGDTLHVENRQKTNNVGYSDESLQSAFGGFLYQPSWGNPVVWSVTREVEWPDNENNIQVSKN